MYNHVSLFTHVINKHTYMKTEKQAVLETILAERRELDTKMKMIEKNNHLGMYSPTYQSLLSLSIELSNRWWKIYKG